MSSGTTVYQHPRYEYNYKRGRFFGSSAILRITELMETATQQNWLVAIYLTKTNDICGESRKSTVLP